MTRQDALLAVVVIGLLVSAPQVTAGVLLEDGFETGNLNKPQSGGGSWGGSNAGSGDRVQVNTTLPKAGNYSLQFVFGGGPSGSDAWAEQRFELGGQYPEIWLKYDLYVPSNYYHRVDPPSANNKFLVHLWAGQYSGGPGLGGGFEVQPDGSGGSIIDFHPFRPDTSHVRDTIRGGKGIELGDRGTWVEFICQVKAASAANNDGIVRVWKTPQNGAKKLIFERTDVKLYNSAGNFFERGYLLGWSNSGFADTTTLYIDNITISDTHISPPLPILTLNAIPASVNSNGTSTLTWSSTNAASCDASDSAWTGSKATSGSQVLTNLTATTTYTMTCTGPGGSIRKSVTITV